MRTLLPGEMPLPSDVDGFDSLAELALNMRSSWNHACDRVWRQLDPSLWDLTRNPWVVLQTVSRERLADVLSNPVFRKIVDDLLQSRRSAAGAPAWFQHAHPQSPLECIAYFSMEFMLSEALPIYTGGLGNVAGDLLKGASDMGLPMVGVGLLYQQSFRQVIDNEGWQRAIFPYSDSGQLPITPLRQSDGEWLRLQLDLPAHSIWLRAWQVQVGRLKLFLLDSNDAANYAPYRGITSELYGGGSDLRLMQEMILGIGGWRLLRALGIEPEVCHLNEGHAAFAILERARSFMQGTEQSFEVALAVTRAGNIFTTHTPVAAAFDRFSPALIAQYLGEYAETALRMTLKDLLALGRENPDDSSEDFNMAYLALRGSGAVNGVSRLHGQVSRHLFAPLFPRWPSEEIPIGHVTNGVHLSSWDSVSADALWTEACGKDRWMGTTETLTQDLSRVSDVKLWQFRLAARTSLVEYARERLSRQLTAAGSSPEMIDRAKHLFDPNVLTLGFARRFTSYKRPSLLLQDPARLMRMLANAQRPVQLIIAGKAHPDDLEGQALIREWIRFIRCPEVRPHAIFLSDYDMLLAEQLVQGVDVWINTPRRPWEACGTSGMKVLVNGGINVSELDGWWAEAFTPEVGWALGDGMDHEGDQTWDATEARELYDLLECEVIPEFYAREQQGIPSAWVARMRKSMSQLAPVFSINRALREYTEQYYLPAATAYRRRAADNGKIGLEMVTWRRSIETSWASIRFGDVTVWTDNTRHTFEVPVYLNDVSQNSVRVELFADAIAATEPEKLEMKCLRPLVGAANGHVYGVQVPISRTSGDYTARLMPKHVGVAIPLECAQILWQR